MQDVKNFRNILAQISLYQKIHGICILLKPNDSRLDVVFKYCIGELLTHLHKEAAKNIVFCFTNARATLYRPGKFFIKQLSEINHTKVIFLKNNFAQNANCGTQIIL